MRKRIISSLLILTLLITGIVIIFLGLSCFEIYVMNIGPMQI